MHRRIYIYVDGESHFIRTQACWRTIRNDEKAKLTQIGSSPTNRAYTTARQFPEGGDRIRLMPQVSFYWDRLLLGYCFHLSPELDGEVQRAVYFTACTADDKAADEARIAIRNYGFEPLVLSEPRDKKNSRMSARKEGLIEKPKGVDISLSIRVLEDAFLGLYDTCFICTSDADFVPLIDRVRRLGKQVAVMGYGASVGDRSPLRHRPDVFVDLTGLMDGIRLARPSTTQ